MKHLCVLVSLLLASQAAASPLEPRYAETPEALDPYGSAPVHRFFQAPIEAREHGKTIGGDEIRIGLLIPPPGTPLGPEGIAVKRGAMLAAREASRAFPASPVKLVIHPDQPTWGASGSEVVRMAYRERVLAMVGSVGGGSSHIAARVALKVMLPMVTTAATDPSLTETRIPWLFRTIPDDRRQSYALLHVLIKTRGFRRIALLRSSDRDDRLGCRELRDGARRLGKPLVAEMQYPRGCRNFATYLQQIRWSRPDAILLRGLPKDAAAALSQLRAMGMTQPCFGWSGLVTPRFLSAAGDAAEGFTAIATVDGGRKDPSFLAFKMNYRKAYGEEPEALAVHAYDGVSLLLRAIRKAGPNRLAIRNALAAMRRYDGIGGTIRFDATMNDLGALYVAGVRDGAFQFRRAVIGR